jgi:TolB-like protein
MPSDVNESTAADKQYDIFISYKKEDALRIAPTVQQLENMGYRIWIDQRHLHAGAIWHVAITKGLKASRCVLLFMSEAAMGSEECAKEISLAKEEARIPVLPMRLEPVSYSELFIYHLKHVQYIDLYPDAERGHARLKEALSQLGIVPNGAESILSVASPPVRPQKPRRRTALVVAVTGLILAAAVVGGLLSHPGGEASSSVGAPPPTPAPSGPSTTPMPVALPVAPIATPTPAQPDKSPVTARPASGAVAKPLGRIAVLYFENNAGAKREDLAPLAKGLCDILIQQMESRDLYDIVERERIEAVMQELKLAASGKIDASTAAQVGKLLGAQRLVLGSYFEAMGRFRIDARIVDVERGTTEAAAGSSGKPEEFMELIDRLAQQLVARHLERTASTAVPKAALAPSGDASAALDLGRAIEALDAGRHAEAIDIAQRLISRQQCVTSAEEIIKKAKP